MVVGVTFNTPLNSGCKNALFNLEFKEFFLIAHCDCQNSVILLCYFPWL